MGILFLFFLSPFLSNFVLEYDIRKAQENKEGLGFNGTDQLLAYADGVKFSFVLNFMRMSWMPDTD